jgi:MerR family transcriptional regulator, thiopeptide resistance regulator
MKEPMFTVTQLARSCGLSRGAILHYESLGLLKPAGRSDANYRRYSQRDQERLRQICLYRSAGLKLVDILAMLQRPQDEAASVLKRRLLELDAEIEALRGHQRVILRLLQNKNSLRRMKAMTKEKWVEIMRATGFSEDDMRRWHVQFEQSAPDDHQQFLEFLHIPTEEIGRIREWSRK